MKNDDKRLTILALDDALVMRTVLKELLKDDFDLHLVSTVHEFKHSMKSISPDIFILDVNLPDGNGIHICRSLRARHSRDEAVIILITASHKKETIEEGYEAGANDFIRKPIIPYEVKSKIQLHEKMIRNRDTLNNAYEYQLQLNNKLRTVTTIVRDHIKTRDIEKGFLLGERIASLTISGYIETVRMKEGIWKTLFSKCIDQNIPYLPFNDLSSLIEPPAKLKQSIQQLTVNSGTESIYCLIIPLVTENNISGYILLESHRSFPDEDIEIVQLFASFFSVIQSRFDTERAIEKMNREYKNEISKVRKIQVSFLPDFHQIKDYDISSAFLPASDISGDFFDAFYIDENIFQIILCDVSGHGIASSYIGNQMRMLFKINSSPEKSPSQLTKTVNEVLSQDLQGLFYFGTAVIFQINMQEGKIRYLNAGHPPILHFDRENSRYSMLENTGPLVGLFEDNEYRDREFTMKDGDCILLYTDGVTEANSGPRHDYEMYGEERLLDNFKSLQKSSSRNIIHSIIGSVYEFTEYADQEDDITVICIRKGEKK